MLAGSISDEMGSTEANLAQETTGTRQDTFRETEARPSYKLKELQRGWKDWFDGRPGSPNPEIARGEGIHTLGRCHQSLFGAG